MRRLDRIVLQDHVGHDTHLSTFLVCLSCGSESDSVVECRGDEPLKRDRLAYAR